jgi:hypothetical protein
MAIVSDFYGTLQEAQDYFDNRFHEKAWSKAKPLDRPKALRAATIIIDTLAYKGVKAAVATYMNSIPQSQWTDVALRAADASQSLEFPRGNPPNGSRTLEIGVVNSVVTPDPPDTAVPEAIRIACYEIAHSLLDGKDPERELENLGISSHGFEGVRTAYDRSMIPVDHIVNGVPNALAWRLIQPFLRDDNAIHLSRVS